MDEQEILASLLKKPMHKRLLGYFKLSGPGYLQSAMTLGGGSIAACMTFGSLLGYELLWVQPLAIILGYFVLAAVAKQVCHTGERPYRAFGERLHPALAILWGASALLATLIWHFPQYTLTANGLVSLGQGIGINLDTGAGKCFIGALLLASACAVVYLYNAGSRGVKIFEFLAKTLVWTIVAAFAFVAIATGIQWKRLALGVTGVTFIRDVMDGGIMPEARIPIVGGLAAALGINMVFLYPYTLLNKGWGKKHKELAYFDLLSGMVVPFLFATSFLMLAVANTIGPKEGTAGALTRNIMDIVPVLGPTFGQWLGNEALGNGAALLLIGLGMVAVGFTTIITHMLACGFIGCEMFNFPHDGKAKFWFSLLPVIGVYGVAMQGFPWQAAITASSLNAPLLPLAVLCFMVLLNSKSFMGEARPKGGMRIFWAAMLMCSVVVMSIAAYYSLTGNWRRLMEHLDKSPTHVAWAAVEEENAAMDDNGGAAAERPFEVFRHAAMNTDFEFRVFAREGDADMQEAARIVREAFNAIDDVEARFSRWRADSQITYINNRAAQGSVATAPDLLDLILFAQQVHRDTHGAFDPTVGPLIKLWGFYKGEGRLPGEGELTEALARVGMEKIAVDRTEKTVAYGQQGILLDLGGIGKGLGLDRAAQVLKQYGVTSAALHAGTSTVVAIGAPPGRPGWTVRIRNPYNTVSWLDEVVLRDESLSTSGSYEKFFELQGKSYCHIFDPRTGMPVEGMLSATAIAPSGMESDALSTAFFVMDEEETRRYCERRPGIRAILVPTPSGESPVPLRISFPEERKLP